MRKKKSNKKIFKNLIFPLGLIALIVLSIVMFKPWWQAILHHNWVAILGFVLFCCLVLGAVIYAVAWVATRIRRKQFGAWRTDGGAEPVDGDHGLDRTASYAYKPAMTDCEMKFWAQFKRLFEDKYIVTPQVVLSSIIEKEHGNRRINELFRVIDFGLFTKDKYELVLLIEINDNTHKTSYRIERDQKVQAILAKAGLKDKIIAFWTDLPHDDATVKRRVMDAIR